MVNSSLLQQVVKNLEQHENSLRIKKLLYCMCKSAWENDKTKLTHIKLQDLVQELRQKNPELEHLKLSLTKVVKTLNKPGEYSTVAKVIFANMGRLYPEFQKLIRERDNKAASSVQAANHLSKSKEKSHAVAVDKRKPVPVKAYDSFAVRADVMNYINPLRAKILLFSTLYQPFDFSNQDWLNLRAHELDELLQNLLSACKTITDLEFKLNRTASSLKEPNENNKAARAIVQCLKPFYDPVEPSANQTQAERSDDEEIVTMAMSNAGMRLNQGGGDIADDNDNTCQFLPS